MRAVRRLIGAIAGCRVGDRGGIDAFRAGPAPCNPLDRTTRPERVVDFGPVIGFNQQEIDLLPGRAGVHPGGIDHGLGTETHAELSRAAKRRRLG